MLSQQRIGTVVSNSFSRIGQKLDKIREANMHTDKEQFLVNILKTKTFTRASSLSKRKPNAKKQKLFQTASRQKLNSFQRCNTKQVNANAIYQQKVDAIKVKPPVFSISRQNRPPLFDVKNNQEVEHKCQKCNMHTLMSTQNSFGIQHQKRIKSSQSLKCFDINKQTLRPFDIQLAKVHKQMVQRNMRLTKLNLDNEEDVQLQSDNKKLKDKMRKTHSFTSYTSRKFLSAKKMQSSQSGLDCFKIEISKYKKNDSSINTKFQKFVDKIRTRYDRECQPWVAKLNYDIQDKLTVQNNTNYYDFSKQSERKINEVNSKYPIRLAL